MPSMDKKRYADNRKDEGLRIPDEASVSRLVQIAKHESSVASAVLKADGVSVMRAPTDYNKVHGSLTDGQKGINNISLKAADDLWERGYTFEKRKLNEEEKKSQKKYLMGMVASSTRDKIMESDLALVPHGVFDVRTELSLFPAKKSGGSKNSGSSQSKKSAGSKASSPGSPEKPKKQSVQIAMMVGGKPSTKEAVGHSVGAYAAVKSPTKKGWGVLHLPTGRFVQNGNIKGKDVALNLARKLQGEYPNALKLSCKMAT